MAEAFEKPLVVGGEPSPSALDPSEETQSNANRIKRAEWPDRPPSSKAMVPGTLANFEYLARKHEITFKFNRVKKRVDIEIPGIRTEAKNRDDILLTRLESLAIQHQMPPTKVRNYITVIGDEVTYDPFADWIDGKSWDGTSRVGEICATIVPEDDYSTQMRDTLVRKWLLSIVAATYLNSGFRARGVLTLQGGQGIGKTSWFASLVTPPELREDAVKLGFSWDGGQKDARLMALRHRIVELGELEGSFRKEIASLKAFITETTDKIRPPYARVESEYPRSTIFGASVNDRQFLLDTTGNSRFWTIAVKEIDYQHDIDMQQVFAELKVAFEQKEQWWLDDAEEAAMSKINEQHRVVGAIEAKIEAALDVDLMGSEGLPRLTASQVLEAIGTRNPTNPQSKEANVTLRRLLGEPSKIRGLYKWYVPWRAEFDGGTWIEAREDKFD
ncbi:VapE domain-containing protein [Alteriqipengyuania sp.]|uniref:VapE domain-containing protein n=1 Tax=Alteriqipengyuania sp. TaxID=2800692 RepID=UPI00321B129A